ncbi:hypothetical protein SHLO109777_16870 [Shewanella loihica]|uniref:Uncharacterized protein n=1 Tax=Shewanella loihica (strain ATCC BAA-1088 / PV-4) TaxID=323850 RepID=A3Q9L9_SHELP|nr:hypothetical protein [Shewanella loihica]ABO22167.1 hypothetical protein Shew_0295 [Shewanella loihica PV-4]
MDTASIDSAPAPTPTTQAPAQASPQEPTQPTIQPEFKHSGLGIAAFTLSIIATLLIFGIVTVAGVMEATTPGGIDETSPEAIVVGMLIFAFIGLALVALGLGIGGLVQKQRKKIFAILGTIFSSVAILATLALIAYGTTID